MKSLVLFSGGQDSTTCLYWAIKNSEPGSVCALGFSYGQRHAVELECAQKIADQAGVLFHVVNLAGAIRGSSLTDHKQDIEAKHERNQNLPSSFTPGRNAIFLAVAAGFAYNMGLDTIVTGVCQTDASGYPDCRLLFIEQQQKALQLALAYPDLKIKTPLINKTKAETWAMAKELGILDIIINDTHTDYNGDRSTLNEWGFGNLDNPASRLRAEGYYQAKEKGWI